MSLRDMIIERIMFAVTEDELRDEFMVTENELVDLSDTDLMELFDDVMVWVN